MHRITEYGKAMKEQSNLFPLLSERECRRLKAFFWMGWREFHSGAAFNKRRFPRRYRVWVYAGRSRINIGGTAE